MDSSAVGKESLNLDQPLLSSHQNEIFHENGNTQNNHNNNNNRQTNFEHSQHSIAGTGPRILDRDGTFAQSRGRWSVSNTRQRHVTSNSYSGVNVEEEEDEPPPFFTTSSRHHRTTNTTATTSINRSLFQRLIARLTNYNHHKRNYTYNNNNSPPSTRRCWDDWFHTLSYTPTCILLLGVFTAYFVTIVVFAGLYLTVNKVGERYSSSGAPGGGMVGGEVDLEDVASFCGMDINNHMEALYFSLSTMATIGYGTSDYYFGECWTPFLLVLLQTLTALAFSSLAIGLLFQRMSRGQKRGRTIVFSDVAVIRKVRGRWYWMFRVAELRKRHIIGAKVRVFCVRHERCPLSSSGGDGVVELETAHFVSHPIPLLDGSYNSSQSSSSDGAASDAGGGMSDTSFEQSILMGLPHVVVHRMDPLSPMMPPRPIWYDESGVPHGPASSSSPSESLTSGGTATAESSSSSLLATVEEGTAHSTTQQQHDCQLPSADKIIEFLQDRQAEIIIYLEGTCEVTGMALQARHSYRIEDIAFHQTFAPCVFPTSTASYSTVGRKRRWNPFSRSIKAKVEQDAALPHSVGDESDESNCALEVDFSQFHDLIPAPYDCHSCPYIPSSSLRP